MKRLSFVAACLYYYGREAVNNPLYFITFLSLVFIIHKLTSWAVWVANL